MNKEFKIKSRNLFSPKSDKPFKVSRSGIELFIECSCCFYLNYVKGIRRPSCPPFNINKAVDTLLKNEFDFYRANQTQHPLMIENGIDAVPFANENLNIWRENFKGIQFLHTSTNLLITGAVDDIWINKKGELIVVDYKATSKNEDVNLDADWQQSYKRQIEIYQWLFRKNGYKVSKRGYFVYCNGKTDKKVFNKIVEFAVSVLPYDGDDTWIETVIENLKKCLISSELPKEGKDCEFCGYSRARIIFQGPPNK